MEDIQKILNKNQYDAVTASNKYLRIIAGAGSGKTRVLTYKIAYLIEEQGYVPSSILAITFTNKAAEEIKKRVESTLNMGKLNLRISTFHAFCARVLREECKAIDYPSNFTVIDDDDQKKIVKDIIKENEFDEKIHKISNCLDYIAKQKNDWVTPEVDLKQTEGNLYRHQKAKIYADYENYLKAQFCLDFDDLILKTITIFDNYEVILSKWQNRLNHILVDEFQDVDKNQYALLKQLAGEKNEVTVVGDPDQTIYTWRGADINIILNFDEDFKGCRTINLDQNYRSTGKILDMANRLIEHNKNRIKKNLFTNADAGAEITFYAGENEIKEAEYVVDNINDLYDGKTNFYRDSAILYRTNAQSAALEQVLMNRGIKYRLYGGLKFYKRMEIKDLIAYLRLVCNTKDDLSCARLIENTGLGIGKTTLEKIKANASTESMSLFEHLKANENDLVALYKKKQGEALKGFINKMKKLHDNLILEKGKEAKVFDDFLHQSGYIDYLLHLEMEDKIDNIHQFIDQMGDFLKQEGSSLDEFVQNVTLMSAQDEMEDDDADYVKLMTIHTAKGLEFDNVFIFGLVDEIFPSSRAVQEKVDGLEEERRLFYVAITRARKRLFLSTSGGQSYFGARRPSRFIREIEVHAKKENITIKHDTNRVIIATGIRAGSIIKHDVFGEGIVLAEHDGIIDVVFKDPQYGRKKLNAAHKMVHQIK